jgi:glycosyltransferase involved in cell wall biosynthesis
VVCTAHGNDINIDPHFNRLTLAQTRWTIRSADAMIAVSRALQERMLQLATPKRSEVIPSGVHLDAFPPMKRSVARASLGLPADRPIALFVGSLLPVKGVQWLIRAFACVRQGVPSSLLVLVGEGPLLEELRAAASDLDIADAVEFAGPQPRSQIPSWMAAANLLVLPSQNEGMPLVILEAMASGLPVVASDVGGIGDALDAPAAGLLAPAGDETALSAAMVRVLTDDDLQRQLGEQGKARARLFSWEINSEKTVSLYTEILRDSRETPHKQHMTLGVA